jgi:hypothetical protein
MAWLAGRGFWGSRSAGFSGARSGMARARSGLASPVRARRPRFVQALLFDVVYKNPSSLPLYLFSLANFTPN